MQYLLLCHTHEKYTNVHLQSSTEYMYILRMSFILQTIYRYMYTCTCGTCNNVLMYSTCIHVLMYM